MKNIRSIAATLAATMLGSWLTLSEASLAIAAPALEQMLFPTVSVMSMSPDGRYVAFAQNSPRTARNMQDQETDSSLFIVDLTGVERPKPVPLGKVRINWIEWASDDFFVFQVRSPIDLKLQGRTVARDVTANKTFTFNTRNGDVFEIFKKTRAESPISEDSSRGFDLGANAQILDRLPDDPEHMIFSANLLPGRGIYKVNILNGDIEQIFVGSSGETYFVNNENKPVFKSRYNPRSRVQTFYASPDEGRSWYKVAEDVVVANRPPPFLPIASTDDAAKMIVIAPRRANGLTGVYMFDVKQRKYADVIYEHPRVDISGFSVGNDGIDRYRVTVNDRKVEHFYLDPKYQRVQAGLAEFFGEDLNVRITQWSDDETKMLVYVTGPFNPGEYYLFDAEKQAVNLIFRTHSFEYAELGETEVMEATMSDGRKVYSYVTHPVGGKDRKAPLIILPHGGPEARDSFDWSFIAEPQVFATRGYRVIQTQFRGGGGYGSDVAREGWGEWGGRMQEDVFESAQVLIDRGLAEKKNVGIWGWSYGGYVAGTAAFKNTDVINCSVAGAGVFDLVESADWERRNFGASSIAYEYWSNAIGDPIAEKEKLDANSAAKNADRVTVPLMLLHGDADFTVPVEQSRIMRGAMRRAGKADMLEYKEYKFEPHTPTLPNWVDIWDRSLDFFDECLTK